MNAPAKSARNRFRERNSMEAKFQRGASWWFLPPIIGKPTHRPIWYRPMRRITNDDIIAVMRKCFDQTVLGHRET